MSLSRFRLLIRAALLTTAAPLGAAACSAAARSSETEMPERAKCIDVTAPSRYTALTLGPDVDGIAVRSRVRTPGASVAGSTAEPAPTIVTLDPIGRPCSRATDPQECASRVSALLNAPESTGWDTPACIGCELFDSRDIAVITAGNDVRLATLDELFAAVSPIDTRDEAAAVLALRNGALDCDTNNARPEGDGWTFKYTREYCDGQVTEYFSHVDRDGKLTQAGKNEIEEGDNSCVEGRRPSMLAPTNVPWLSSLASCFAEIAHMEAAAVLAFDELEHQLRVLQAPWELQMGVHRARADEVAHARITGDLARRFGGSVSAPRVLGTRDLHAPDGLLRLAVENAVEGCVREAYGALVAAHQATHASDPAVRAAFVRIAKDEAEHAELSFALDAWLMSRLAPRDRLRVESARADAWRDLAGACAAVPAPDVVRVAGIPTAAQARALLMQLRWALAA